MKRVLMIATVPSMIGQFNMSNIHILKELGYEVYVACNFEDRGVWSKERIEQFKEELKKLEVVAYQVDFKRNAFDLKHIFLAYQQIKKIVKEEQINLIHCHTPVGGVIGRLVGYKTGTKVIYTAHGFHFYAGGPLLNWLIYYPVEKVLSYLTDVLITINQEDYKRAEKKFHAKKVEYVPGVGVDTSFFKILNTDRKQKREELGISSDTLVLLSVGELNKNKNHRAVIEALKTLEKEVYFKNIKYFICGRGELKNELEELVHSLHLDEIVSFLGFRSDVAEIYRISDIFVFPSFREGLSVALMEAMANGLPIIATKIRGNTDLIKENKGGKLIAATDINGFASSIKMLACKEKTRQEMGRFNQKYIELFSLDTVNKKMISIYCDMVLKEKK